ncbi:MAG: hypothetical protein JOZ70_15985, partial [Pseudolabrys sp.]|nr:hypothetical protein [Pseudolabrys sp.]
KKCFAWGELIAGDNQTVAPGSFFDGTPEGKKSGWYRFYNLQDLHDGTPLSKLWQRKPRTSNVAPALDGYSVVEVAWWIDQKLADEWDLSQQDWAMFGGALKLHFGEDGRELFQRMSHDPQQAEYRFDKFSAEYRDGNRTLHSYLDRDVMWMFRHQIGCPRIPAPTLPPLPVPAEIIELHKREREEQAARALGPLADHPELTAAQAGSLDDFFAHLPSGKIIHVPSRGLWAAGSFDKHIGRIRDPMKANGPGMLATTWLSQHRSVQSMGWDPASEMIIEGKILTEAGWIHANGCRSFNTYLPPTIKRKPGDVSPWLDHVRAIYPNEADHIVAWFAYRVQRPGDKVNHGLVFVGAPGIGKDTIVEPVTASIGAHNFKSISAASFFKSDFNGYLKSVMLRIDEVHDLGGESKYAFHDRTKTILAAPPTAHQINEKHTPHYSAVNVCGVILTSNHDDALYLPRDDRRHFVCTSDRSKDDFAPGHFDRLYEWFAKGGNEAIAHYLANLDLSAFNAKAPPPKTEGWRKMVAAGLAPESGDLADAIEALGNPPALTLAMVRWSRSMGDDLRQALGDPKRRRNLPKRLAEVGYVEVRNPDADSGKWRMGEKTMIYGRRELSDGERLNAARTLYLNPPSAGPQELPPVPTRD